MTGPSSKQERWLSDHHPRPTRVVHRMALTQQQLRIVAKIDSSAPAKTTLRVPVDTERHPERHNGSLLLTVFNQG